MIAGSIPADVRASGTQAVSDYKAALGFEQLLAGQLVKELATSSQSLSDGPYAQPVQEALTTALTGNLGLAQQLYKDLRG
ncbi:MAG TPA: hypothetical protein VNS09_08615 [Solirubrobacter sp.]|nr:hypothetical protein [Solirubrobacter sp.]